MAWSACTPTAENRTSGVHCWPVCHTINKYWCLRLVVAVNKGLLPIFAKHGMLWVILFWCWRCIIWSCRGGDAEHGEKVDGRIRYATFYMFKLLFLLTWNSQLYTKEDEKPEGWLNMTKFQLEWAMPSLVFREVALRVPEGLKIWHSERQTT